MNDINKIPSSPWLRGLIYAVGMLVLALGIVLNTKASLGVSPIVSVAYCFSVITGSSFGNACFIWYAIFVIVILFLHRKRIREDRKLFLQDVLQLPLSLLFTRFMNLFSSWIPTLSGALLPRFLVLALAIICIGVGAALVLRMRLIPNPGDGIVQAISDTVGKPLGITKNFFDLSCVILSVLVSLLLTRKIIGIGFGTVAAALGTGRVIAVFNRLIEKKQTAR